MLSSAEVIIKFGPMRKTEYITYSSDRWSCVRGRSVKHSHCLQCLCFSQQVINTFSSACQSHTTLSLLLLTSN